MPPPRIADHSHRGSRPQGGPRAEPFGARDRTGIHIYVCVFTPVYNYVPTIIQRRLAGPADPLTTPDRPEASHLTPTALLYLSEHTTKK
jgi:hypothetical protein